MTYTTEEKITVGDLKHVSKMATMLDIIDREKVYQNAISEQKNIKNADIQDIKTNAKAELSIKINEVIAYMRNTETEA